MTIESIDYDVEIAVNELTLLVADFCIGLFASLLLDKATAFSTIATASSFVARSAANDELEPEVAKAAQANSTVSRFGTGCPLLLVEPLEAA